MSPSLSPQMRVIKRAQRNLVIGGIALALAATVTVVALPLGIRGQGVAQIETTPRAYAVGTGDDVGLLPDGDQIDAPLGVVDLHTAPVASLGDTATATLELVGDSSARAHLLVERDGSWIDTPGRIELDHGAAADGIAFRVKAAGTRQNGSEHEPVTVRLTVSQGLLPDVDEIEIDLFDD